MSALVDGEARRLIAEDLDRSFLVEAAAGTGKTTALVGRMVETLRQGRARLAEIVAVTFTEKAAGEMKLRLRGALEVARQREAAGAGRDRLDRAVAELESARISTIHGFCSELLRARPVEAGVDPDFEVAPEDGPLGRRAFAEIFQAELQAPSGAVRRLLRRARDPRRSLERAFATRVDLRDHPTPWRRPDLDRTAGLRGALEDLRDLASLSRLASNPVTDPLAKSLGEVARVFEGLSGEDDLDAVEAALVGVLGTLRRARPGRGRYYGERLLRADVVARRDGVRGRLEALVADLDADLASQLFEALGPAVERYGEIKSRAGALDFLDLLIGARDLLRTDATSRDALRAQAKVVFVDEFQDTDPLQAEVLLTLASGGPPPGPGEIPMPRPGALFLVGDPKQSIYRFRRADVALYERIKRELAAGGVPTLELTTNFRSVPQVQRAVNRAFGARMDGLDGRPAYVPLAPHRPPREGMPAVVALSVPSPYGRYGRVWAGKVAESAADAVGAFVAWAIGESGWTVGPPGGERPLATRDICLLFRQMRGYGRDRTQPYVAALEARELPHVLVGGRALADREEVLALATALRAIEHPQDALSVYATLRGPYFALTDAALLVHRERVGPLHPLAPVGEALLDPERRPVAEALALLGELHRQRNRRPFADTMARFLDATRAHAGLGLWPNGEQTLGNVLRLVEVARRFEGQGGESFRAFVELLEEQLEEGRGVTPPVVEEGAEGVRLMTVHGAKGLEFPVVVLCDPTQEWDQRTPSRYVDAARRLWATPLAGCVPLELREAADEVRSADAAEELRITYVAATRARDMLVVPAVADGPQAGWVDPLHRAVYPAASSDPRPAPGCPAFGRSLVVERPPDVRPSPLHPGLHEVGEPPVEVVWWDPHTLDLGRQPKGGLRRQTLLAEAADGADGREQREAHRAWAAERRRTLERGAAPSQDVASVTSRALAAVEEGRAPSRTVETVVVSGDRRGRPRGKRFGTLVHALLADVTLPPVPGELAGLAAYWGRVLDADAEERGAAVEVVEIALAHPLMAAAAAAERVREHPIHAFEAGRRTEGVIDLAFRDEAGWVVVDYKTDAGGPPETAGADAYRAQVAAYVEALEEATGEPARGVLLYV
jgi:ATP-dependent helicase/nuclease subunit A